MNGAASSVSWGFAVEAKGVTPSQFRQVHGNALVEIADEAAARRAVEHPAEADGAFTRASGVTLHVFTADCIPLLFWTADPAGPVAAVHCGWRGAMLGIARRTLELPAFAGHETHVAIGPCILGCCFEVKEDFVAAFESAGRDIRPFLERRGNRLFCHLDRFVRETELSTIPAERIHPGGLRCTYCSSPELPSYRRNKGTDPRLRSWIVRHPRI